MSIKLSRLNNFCKCVFLAELMTCLLICCGLFITGITKHYSTSHPDYAECTGKFNNNLCFILYSIKEFRHRDTTFGEAYLFLKTISEPIGGPRGQVVKGANL